MKRCIECNELKPLNAFRITRQGKTQYRRCKKCYHKMTWRYFKSHPVKIMLMSAKHRAKRDGLPFSLTEKDIVIPDVCPVLGVKLVAGDRRNHDFAPTIDKIDPLGGYVKGNIVVISHRANRIKADATIEELAKIVNFYAGNRMQVRRDEGSTGSQSPSEIPGSQDGSVDLISTLESTRYKQ